MGPDPWGIYYLLRGRKAGKSQKRKGLSNQERPTDLIMYLHLGQNEIVADHRVIGIFDLDKCSYSKKTRDYLSRADQEGVVLDVSGDIPKSFVVCDHPYHEQIIYLSQLNTSTLKNRAESRKLEL